MSVSAAIRAALGGHDPSPEQRRAIEYPASPLAIISGAGSGKTAVMAARIAHLIVTLGAQPSQILGLTFTNKAAQELEERVRAALEPLGLSFGDEVSVFTYHSFADRLLRDWGPKIGIEPDVGLLSEAQAHMLVADLLEDITFEHIAVTSVPTLIGRVRSLADACANHLLDPEKIVVADADLKVDLQARGQKMPTKLLEAMELRPDYCRAVRAYIERKRALARIDYGDQIAFAHKLVSERPEVAAALQQRWPFVLLDEYQDTNVAQRKMMEAIYPAGSAITVVGDPDQSIYAWRGATLHNILAFPDQFKTSVGERAARRTLATSFRSANRILRVADAIISQIPVDSRGGERILRHHDATGEGDVSLALVGSDEGEARLIASDIKELVNTEGGGLEGAPLPYEEIAILCRKRRLFAKLQVALRDEGIPVEVVGLGGLMTVPEIVDLLAYLRLMTDPGDNIAFARIAMGPRWRIHYRDLAALARWAAANTSALQRALEQTDEARREVDPGQERFSLSESLSRMDEVDDLSDEARRRLGSLHSGLEAMRADVQGRSVAEAVERVLASSGIEDELAAAGTDVAQAARANLGALLDQAAAFSPLEGDATLTAFLDYLSTAQDVEDLEVAQPRRDNAVKLMTIHQAKGLEFDVVFVPGMAKGIFPDAKINDDPTKSAPTLPYWAREDSKHLPRFEGVLTRFREGLRERALQDERRLAYVAMTRARKRLHLSAAHWYGTEYERKTPNGPGEFLCELAGVSESGERKAGGGHPSVTVRSFAPCPEDNPIRLEWEARAREWPSAEQQIPDALFPAGWRRAVEDALAEPSTIERLAAAADVNPFDLERANDEVAKQLELVTTPFGPMQNDALTSLSVSSIVQLARCPKQFYWSVVRPLPRRPSFAARLGQEVHRWIELRSIGQQRLDDPAEPPDLSPEEIGGEGGAGPPLSVDALRKRFEASRFATLRPRYMEQPFVLSLPRGFLVRGRIDAVYVHPDDTWELVDYKTGREPDEEDAAANLQLAIYAMAAQRVWGIDPENLRVTYLYLGTGREATTRAAELGIDEAHLVAMFEHVQSETLEPIPSRICHSCDFLRFCPTGRDFVDRVARENVGA